MIANTAFELITTPRRPLPAIDDNSKEKQQLVVIFPFLFQVSANNFLLIHLALVDVLLCFFFFAFALPTIARSDNWLDSVEWACTIEGLLLTILHPMAIWTTCGLNCDRFYAIASPLHYSAIVNPRRVAIGLGCGWLAIVLLAIPPLITRIAPFDFVTELAACAPDFTRSGSIWYSGVYSLLTFVVPAFIILGCNIKVGGEQLFDKVRIKNCITFPPPGLEDR